MHVCDDECTVFVCVVSVVSVVVCVCRVGLYAVHVCSAACVLRATALRAAHEDWPTPADHLLVGGGNLFSRVA
jgi:hypothetical protein